TATRARLERRWSGLPAASFSRPKRRNMHTKIRRDIVLLALAVVSAVASASGAATAARSNEVPKRISVPGTPLAIASGYGSLWVAGHDGTTLYRINPRTGRIRAKIAEGTNACG